MAISSPISLSLAFWSSVSFSFSWTSLSFKAAAPEFEEVAAFQAGSGLQSVRREGETVAKPLRSEYVTGSYFSLLGVRPSDGRFFSADEARANAGLPVVVANYALWRRLGFPKNFVGSQLQVNGHSFTVIGWPVATSQM